MTSVNQAYMTTTSSKMINITGSHFHLVFLAVKTVFHKHSYSNQKKKTNVKKSRVKSTPKANTYLHNGDSILTLYFTISYNFIDHA